MGLAQGEAGWCYEEGPNAVVGGTWAESAPPTLGAHLTCRATPANSHPEWFPGPRMALPLLASSLLPAVDPAVTMEPGPKALLETKMPMEAAAAPGPGDHCHSLWKTGRLRRSPLKATAGRAGPSGTSPPLCSPGCAAANLMPDRHPKVWKVLHLLASSQSVQFMPFCLPPESSTLHIKNVPSRMQCKQCRRKVQLLGEAGMSWEASPYTSVAMTHSFLSSDIKHTD